MKQTTNLPELFEKYRAADAQVREIQNRLLDSDRLYRAAVKVRDDAWKQYQESIKPR